MYTKRALKKISSHEARLFQGDIDDGDGTRAEFHAKHTPRGPAPAEPKLGSVYAVEKTLPDGSLLVLPPDKKATDV
ncbi:MAG: hypothetical protein Q7K33_04540 [Candidatus Berkelbacteria bacterium]|nr:hypothetical protein [Candidatus Berkelbacteria bacterium]